MYGAESLVPTGVTRRPVGDVPAVSGEFSQIGAQRLSAEAHASMDGPLARNLTLAGQF